MDEDHRELLRRLFAAATEMTETAHETATTGQSEALTAGDYAGAAPRLQAAARDIAALAEAAAVIAGPVINAPRLARNRAPERAGLARRGKRGWVVT